MDTTAPTPTATIIAPSFASTGPGSVYPISGYGNDSTPTIRIASISASDDVNVFDDSSCTTSVIGGWTTNAAGTTEDETVTTAQTAGSTVNYHVRARDRCFGNTSTCVAVSPPYTYMTLQTQLYHLQLVLLIHHVSMQRLVT